MDLLELYQDEECIPETSADHFVSPDIPGTNDTFGDPPTLPRIGNHYQVELPPLEAESERLKLIQSPIDADGMVDISVGVGLPIPVMWLGDQVDEIRHELEEFSDAIVGAGTDGLVNSENKNEICLDYQSSHPSVNLNNHYTCPQTSSCKGQLLDDTLEHNRGFARLTSHECPVITGQVGAFCGLQQKKTKGCTAMPGSPSIPWHDDEKEIFLLGLYIFGKNLQLVRKFMESKQMGDILSFYYGKFYRSDAYRRWLECRKIRSRRCIHGQRIFTGWRQQELLSRLLPNISVQSQDGLLEATKTFSEGRTSLEEYVFTLKATVGLKVLVEAVGIGKGKNDLTGTVMDPVRTNQVISTRSEIPVGKACSSLSSADIIKFLTGDFRLSKARSNDLFWEAVWPRLLAKGWHSEQPKHQVYATSKHALVFLVPGIKKFSRRKLVKGNHYFDSISDVLNKVASEPSLLELEIEGTTGSTSIKDENGLDVSTKLDQDGPSDQQHNCYLRPRLPEFGSELMKFTVVDTSLVDEETPYKIRGTRSLPVDNACHLVPLIQSGQTESESSVELPNSDDTLLKDREESDNKELGNSPRHMLDKGMESHMHDHVDMVSNRMLVNGENLDGQYPNMLNHHPVEDTKCNFSRKAKTSRQNYLVPDTKRRRLTVCEYTGTASQSCTFSKDQQLKKKPSGQSKSLDISNMVVAEVGSSQAKVLTDFCAKGSTFESSDGIHSGNYLCPCTINEPALSEEKPQPRTLIDLNIPQLPEDFDFCDPLTAEVADSQDNTSETTSSFTFEKNQQPDDFQAVKTYNGMLPEEQPTVNSRRQSTRNRPPTARALEALASGFLSTRRKGRGKKAPSSCNSVSRSYHNARKNITASVSLSSTEHRNAITEIGALKGEGDECSGNNEHARMFSISHVQPERKGTHELLGVPLPAYRSG